MGNQSSASASAGYASESVIPFAPAAKNAVPNGVDQLDTAGRTILNLLHKAAGVAEENSKQALDLAQKLSHQLKAAENRMAEPPFTAGTTVACRERQCPPIHMSVIGPLTN